MICYFLFYHKEAVPSDTNKVLGSIGLVMVFYRSFSYLRIINSFTTLIGMINTIIQKLVIFFLILIYFFVASGILILKLNPKGSPILNLGNAYVWTFFGGIEGDDFIRFDYAGIAMIFGTVMVTIILLNILIAFLSNLFSRLEDKQKSNDLKEKASMILDLEVVIHFFRFIVSGKSRTLRKFELERQNVYEELLDPSQDVSQVGRLGANDRTIWKKKSTSRSSTIWRRTGFCTFSRRSITRRKTPKSPSTTTSTKRSKS